MHFFQKNAARDDEVTSYVLKKLVSHFFLIEVYFANYGKKKKISTQMFPKQKQLIYCHFVNTKRIQLLWIR